MTRVTRGGVILGIVTLAWMGWLLWVLGAETRPAALLVAYLGHTGPGLLAAVALFAGAWGLGSPLRRLLLPDFGRTDPISAGLVAIALGWVVLQSAGVVLGSLGWFSTGTARGLVGLALVAALVALRRSQGLAGLWRSPRHPVAMGLAWAGSLALLAPTLLAVGAPPIGPDELQYHHRFVEHLLREGRFAAYPDDAISGFAQGLHAQVALGAAITGSSALRPICLGFGLAAILAGERIARRTFGSGAALIYLPVVCGAASLLRVLPTLGTDLPVGFFVAVATLVVLDWSQAPASLGMRPVVLGLLGGAALAVKFTAPIYVAPLYAALLVLLVLSERGDRTAVAAVLGAAVISGLFALPWLLKNMDCCGHPLYPVYGLTGPDQGVAAFRFNFTENYGPGTGWAARLRSPWDLFILGREFDRRHFLGRLNAWPLLALPGILLSLRRGRQARVLAVVVGLGFVGWALALRRVAYLLPLWPALAALTAGGLAALGTGLPRQQQRAAAVMLGIVLTLAAVAETARPYLDLLDDAGVATGQEATDAYMDRRLEGAAALRWINEHVDRSEPVALFWTWHGGTLPHRLHWIGAEEFTPLRIVIHEAGTASGLRDTLQARGIRWVLARRHQFVRTSYPSLSETEFELGFVEPIQRADAMLSRFGIRRFASGPFVVYEIP